MMGELPALLRGVILLGGRHGSKGTLHGEVSTRMTSSVLAAFMLPLVVSTMAFELPYVCSFEDPILCEMEPRQGGDFNWTRHSGWTPSADTGPASAADGWWYIYIESSHSEPDNRKTGDRAYIQTPTIGYAGEVCIEFRYHMYGHHIGRLVVFVDTRGENSSTTFTKNGNKDMTWHKAGINVEDFRSGERVVFMAECGDGLQGDIALDDLQIYKGLCHNIDECREGNGGCSDQCLNTVGSYHCQCPTGYSLAADNRTCKDIDECATEIGNECDHVCINVEGSHNCSCRDTYIRATDGHHCIECYYAYKPKVKSSQLFTSECPTTASHTDITLADCLQEACLSQAGVVAYFNMVCDLKQCDGGNLRLKIVSGSSGWDIYMLNTTWSAATNDGNQGNLRSGDDFPLVPVVVGVLVPVTLLVAIVIVVVLLRRRRQTREGSESVHYENDPGRNITDREHDKTSPPITEVHSSAGIYEEVAEPDNKQQVPGNETYDDVTGDPVSRIPQVKEAAPNDASEGSTYMNAAFQGDCRYQGLGPDGNPRHYDTIE